MIVLCHSKSAGQVTLDNLVIEGCGNPAIKLNQQEVVSDGSKQELPTTFQAVLTRLALSNNGKAENFRNGGALKIEPGWNVTINACEFLDNKADIGGAIHSEGSNVSVDTTIFDGNVALHKVLISLFLSSSAQMHFRFDLCKEINVLKALLSTICATAL